MTTTIDIIDTAVKIGLGAIIGGFTSYILAVRSQKHEKETQISKDGRELIKDLSLKLERVDHLNAVSALNFHAADLAAARKSSISATEEICAASALANIIGSNELVRLIHDISDTLDNIYHELNGAVPDEGNLYNFTLRLVDLKRQAYPHIRAAYNAYIA